MQLVVDEYTDSTRGERKPTLFYPSEADRTLLLLADASETVFSRCYQPLIDVVKASFIDSLLQSDGPLQERLRSACRAIGTAMRGRFSSSTEFGEECYSAVFVVLGIEEGRAFPFWIGSPQAKHLRGGVCIRATIPQVTVIPTSNLIVTNNSMTTSPDSCASVATDEPWPLVSGDVLVLADHRLFAQFSERDLAGVIRRARGNKAKALVDAAQSLAFTFAQSAIVARLL